MTWTTTRLWALHGRSRNDHPPNCKCFQGFEGMVAMRRQADTVDVTKARPVSTFEVRGRVFS